MASWIWLNDLPKWLGRPPATDWVQWLQKAQTLHVLTHTPVGQYGNQGFVDSDDVTLSRYTS